MPTQSFGHILKYGLKGGVMATILNLILFEVNLRFFGVDFGVVMSGKAQSVTEIQVIFASLMPAVVAVILYFLLLKKTKNPNKIFKIIAGIVLVLSLYSPITAANMMSTKLVLSVMHIIAAFEITKSLINDSHKNKIITQGI